MTITAAKLGKLGLTDAWARRWPRLLLADPFACVAVVVLVVALLAAVFGPLLLGDAATAQNLYAGNLEPFTLRSGWLYVLGGDPLGRSILAQLAVGARNTIFIAGAAVLVACAVGTVWGMWAGFHGGWRENLSMRTADVILSFPSLLLAVVLLYVFSSSPLNLVVVLAIARLPVFLRTARIQTVELRTRLYVDAARTFGARAWPTIARHIAPSIAGTVVTVAALDFSIVTLTESALDFLGVGIQTPQISWGLMVAAGRDRLESAWWQAAFPGLAIMVVAVSATLLAAWLRIAADPEQRWRLTVSRRRRAETADYLGEPQ